MENRPSASASLLLMAKQNPGMEATWSSNQKGKELLDEETSLLKVGFVGAYRYLSAFLEDLIAFLYLCNFALKYILKKGP